MRADIQEIFKLTPHDKQVMMFSATLSQDMRTVCKKFMSNVRASATPDPSWEPAPATGLRLSSIAPHTLSHSLSDGARPGSGRRRAPSGGRRPGPVLPPRLLLRLLLRTRYGRETGDTPPPPHRRRGHWATGQARPLPPPPTPQAVAARGAGG